MLRALVPPIALTLALPLASCGAQGPAPSASPTTLDDELAEAASGNATDPLVQAVLADPLLTDMDLREQADADAVRPPPQPYAAMIPLDGVVAAPPPDLGPLKPTPPIAAGGCPSCTRFGEGSGIADVVAIDDDPAVRACAAGMTTSATWANRLSIVPLYRNARVVAAAGTDTPGCAIRVARFSAAEPVATLLAYYTTQAPGFGLDHRSDGRIHLLSGQRARLRFALYLAPRRDGGSDAVLMTVGGSPVP